MCSELWKCSLQFLNHADTMKSVPQHQFNFGKWKNSEGATSRESRGCHYCPEIPAKTEGVLEQCDNGGTSLHYATFQVVFATHIVEVHTNVCVCGMSLWCTVSWMLKKTVGMHITLQCICHAFSGHGDDGLIHWKADALFLWHMKVFINSFV
jgi:hypothetical protein